MLIFIGIVKLISAKKTKMGKLNWRFFTELTIWKRFYFSWLHFPVWIFLCL